MGFIAEYTIQSPLLSETHERAPEMILEMVDLQILAGGQGRYVFWARDGDFDAFEAALGDDPTVGDVVTLTELADRRLYRLTFADEVRSKMTYPDASDYDIVFLGAHSTDEGVHYRAQFPTRGALYSFRERCREKGIPFQLDSIYRESGGDTHSQYGLTDPQREALVLAHRRGYYGGDRDASLEEIAAELGISRQALAGRLRRGIDRLVANTLLR